MTRLSIRNLSLLDALPILIALALGAAAWTPLIAWNMENAEAGLRFQLVDRHPWAFHADGAWFLALETLLVTPLAWNRSEEHTSELQSPCKIVCRLLLEN